MTTDKLISLVGVALIASGILATIGFSVHPPDSSGSNQVMWLVGHILIILGFLLNFLGLVGLYTLTAQNLGGFGLLGFLVACVSLFLYLGKFYWSGFIYPLVIAQHPEFISEYGFNPGSDPVDPVVRMVFYLGPILFAVGFTIFGLALLRVGTFPAIPVWLVVAGSLLVGFWVLFPAAVQHFSVIVALVYTVGIAWLGYLVAKGRYGPT
ncbi:hypothetical protein MYX65_04155 [Acidobacteria bacterium AH-259-L09]|nr:hypothetical protein [Acidobacteria bacterium AH-259-L09]